MKFISNKTIFERTQLSEVLPLSTPLVIFIEPARSCNFKCGYCYHSFSRNKINELNIINEGIMEFDLYTKVIDDIKSFPDKIKCLHLTSCGEPLLNKKLPEMIRYAKESNKFERINIVTNGILLNPKLNLKLIDAGLDSIKISIQGVTSTDYKNITNIKVDLNKLIQNIKHLYNNRNTCKLYIKIGDISLKNDYDISEFSNMFYNISDGLLIEHIFDIDNNLNTDNKMISNKGINICSMPFYILNIGFNGDVIPCCYYNMNSFGNVSNIKIKDIWNSDTLNIFRYSLLTNIKTICNTCNIPKFCINEKDNINNCVEKLIEIYK
jgi:GTP 3',8-cyclase